MYVETIRQKSETRGAGAAAYEAHPALESVAAALTSWYWAHLNRAWWQLAPFEPFEQDIRQNSGPVEHISIAAQLVPLGSGHYTNYHGHTHA